MTVKKIVMLIRIRHTRVALLHKKTVLSLETSSEINFEFIKFVKKGRCLPMTKTIREYYIIYIFVKDVFSFMHIDKRLSIIFPLELPHHGRPKTAENKGSNIRYNKIYITFSDWVIFENIISGNVVITFLGLIFSTITQSGNVIFIYYHPLL